MLRQRNASRHNSRTLTERIKPIRNVGMARMPRCAKEIEEKVTMTETRPPSGRSRAELHQPGKADSAERKTSMQMKNSSTALAM
jgi:hypothetical protein